MYAIRSYYAEEYAEIPQYVKDDNFVLVDGRNEDGTVKYITIPKGNLIRLMTNPTEHFIRITSYNVCYTKLLRTTPYFVAGATGTVIGLGAYATGASVTEVLAVTDSGYVTKKNGSSYTQISGQSYPSGTNVRMVQLGGYTYLASPDTTFTQYNGNILQVFATISPPTMVSVTNVSGISGTATWSWKVVARITSYNVCYTKLLRRSGCCVPRCSGRHEAS